MRGIKVAFSGSANGASLKQLEAMNKLLGEWHAPGFEDILAHGDCVGADSSADRFARIIGYKVEIHPPTNPVKRAFCYREGDVMYDAYPYHSRNMHIVDWCDQLLATPKKPRGSGGTWFTVDYALRRKKPVVVVYADGTIEEYNAVKLHRGYSAALPFPHTELDPKG